MTMMRLRLSILIAVLIVLPGTLRAQTAEDTGESTIIALVRAIYSADIAAFRKLMLPDARIHLLTAGAKVNEQGLSELAEDPKGLQIIPKRGPEYRGGSARRDSSGRWPLGTTAVFSVAHYRGPMSMVVEKTPDGWRVDPRWWLAQIEMGSIVGDKTDSPEHSARELIFALLEGDTASALRHTTPDARADILFRGAPSQREPSGHLEALAAEMPMVVLKPGEFRRLLTGRVVEGSTAPDVKLIVGMMGSVEMPFVVRRVGTEWRVEPEPYFALINQ